MNNTMSAVQELKSERVQGELVAAEVPLVLRLKSERVQEPAAGADAADISTVFELAVSQRKKLTIDVWSLQVRIILEEPEPQTPGVGRAA